MEERKAACNSLSFSLTCASLNFVQEAVYKTKKDTFGNKIQKMALTVAISEFMMEKGMKMHFPF